MSKYTGQDSDIIRAELAKLRADAAAQVLDELASHNERIDDLEDWRTSSRVTEARAGAATDNRERRLKALEDFVAKYQEGDRLTNERFRARVAVWGTVAVLVWPLVVMGLRLLRK